MSSADVAVRVTPRAHASAIAGERDGVLLVRVRAPPANDRANTELCHLTAKHAGVGVRSVTVARGASTREKLVHVERIDEKELWRRPATALLDA